MRASFLFLRSHDDNSSRESRTRIVAQGIEFPDFTIQGLTTLNDMVITQVSYTPTVKVRLLRILFFSITYTRTADSLFPCFLPSLSNNGNSIRLAHAGHRQNWTKDD